MSVGSGYRYLLPHTATGDVPRAAGESLTAYHAASGNPPGQWLGRGLAGFGVPEQVPGSTVTEEAMAVLYGKGRHAVTGEQLGPPYPVYKSQAQRVTEAVEGLPAGLPAPEGQAAVERIKARIKAAPRRHAVAGLDLTFTVPKSPGRSSTSPGRGCATR